MSQQEAFRYAQPYHVILSRTSKGTYSWEVSVHSTTPLESLRVVRELDRQLREEYGQSSKED